MSWDNATIALELEKALSELKVTEPDRRLYKEVERLVWRNHRFHRAQRWLKSNAPHTPTDYVTELHKSYRLNSETLKKLQVSFSEAEWISVYEMLQVQAYKFLIYKGFTHNAGTEEYAIVCANEAVLRMVDAQFPYDVPFGPWMINLLRKTCVRQMKRDLEEPPEGEISLEMAMVDGVPLGSEDDIEQVDIRMDLENALSQIPVSWCEGTRARYFDGYTIEEIAVDMRRTKRAVYNYNHKAIQRLREILSEDGYDLLL